MEICARTAADFITKVPASQLRGSICLNLAAQRVETKSTATSSTRKWPDI